MKIGVDAGCLGVSNNGLKVGVYHIVKNALKELAQLDTKNTYYLYSFYPIEKSLMKALGKRMKNIVVRPARGWMKLWLPFRLVIDRIDIFLAANQAVPLRLPGSRYKIVGIIYDIAFERYPQLYAYAASVSKHKLYSVTTARLSDRIISISQKTKEDLIDLYHVPEKHITVAYPGIVPLPKERPYQSPYPYFLYVGALKKGKNIPTLLRAYTKLRNSSRQRVQLVLAGGNTWMDPDIQQVLDAIPSSIRQDIRLLGAVTNPKKLSSLYRGALAFVCPSLYEGFGLPFVEAMSVGCPVIGSNRGSIPEVVGNAGILTDAYDITGLVRAMNTVVKNKKKRSLLVLKGKRQSKKYSFKTFAKAIYSAIETLA